MGAAAVLVLWAGPAGGAGGAVSISPNTGLVDGQIVTVTVRGFGIAPADLFTLQCRPNPVAPPDCDGDTQDVLVVDGDGNGEAPFRISAPKDGRGGSVLVVTVDIDDFGSGAVSAPLDVAAGPASPGAPTGRSTTTTAPPFAAAAGHTTTTPPTAAAATTTTTPPTAAAATNPTPTTPPATTPTPTPTPVVPGRVAAPGRAGRPGGVGEQTGALPRTGPGGPATGLLGLGAALGAGGSLIRHRALGTRLRS